MLKDHSITGAEDTNLHIVETGNPKGRPIVFIHGFSQSWLAWKRQLESDLADKFRLFAVDLRGHGLSDKPREGYTDSKLWAGDIRAAIQKLDIDHPILCGWSYGPLVILDYLRHYGEDDIGGINFIGGVTKLGSDEAAAVLTDEFLELVPGFFSADAEESVLALDSLLRLCFLQELSTEDRFLMLGYNTWVPPYVRQAMFSRSFDNDDLLPTLRKPVLITHGTEDAVVKPAVLDEQMNGISNAQIQMMKNAGHACFWDAAAAYNKSLSEFAEAAQKRE